MLNDHEVCKINIDRFEKFKIWRIDQIKFDKYPYSYLSRCQRSDIHNMKIVIDDYLDEKQPLKFTIKEMKLWLDNRYSGIDLEEPLRENKLYYFEKILLLLLAYEIITPLLTQKEIDMKEVN